MNEENINNSFDTLFENEGWIITKNEKGKVKLATCEHEETNMYEKTRDWKVKEVDKTKTDTFRLPQNELYKTVRFFIRDLLHAEKQNKYFCCNDILFINVYICGTVVSFYERYDKYSIIVDDGTSSIKCIMEEDVLDHIKQNSNILNDNELNELVKQQENNTGLQATIMTRRAIKNLHNLVPTLENLELGDVVKVFGTLSEYNGNRYVFIKKIVKEPKKTIFHITYLEDMLQIYSEIYKKL